MVAPPLSVLGDCVPVYDVLTPQYVVAICAPANDRQWPRDGIIDSTVYLLDVAAARNPATWPVFHGRSTTTSGLLLTRCCPPNFPKSLDGYVVESKFQYKVTAASISTNLVVEIY